MPGKDTNSNEEKSKSSNKNYAVRRSSERSQSECINGGGLTDFIMNNSYGGANASSAAATGTLPKSKSIPELNGSNKSYPHLQDNPPRMFLIIICTIF